MNFDNFLFIELLVCICDLCSQSFYYKYLCFLLVLEEMPPFPERESSLLAKLKKKKGGVEKDDLEQPTAANHSMALSLIFHCLYFLAFSIRTVYL